MATSSILGADIAPAQPAGRDSAALGPSDNSDSGSDAAGTPEAHADSDAVGTGERGAVTPNTEGREGGDILPDQVIGFDEEEQALAKEIEYTDLDAQDIEGDAGQER